MNSVILMGAFLLLILIDVPISFALLGGSMMAMVYMGSSLSPAAQSMIATVDSFSLLAIPLFIDYFKTGLVVRQPTAILTTGMMLLAWLSFVCGLILDTVTRGRWELKRLQYLSLRPPGSGG